MQLIFVPKKAWAYGMLIAISGLAVWSYGFNNVPLIRPLPLVDALVYLSVILGFMHWWPLHRVRVVRRLLFFLSFLSLIILLRLIVDIPKSGVLAIRDALFAFELWVLLPAIALGNKWGERRLGRYLLWLFSIATAWFILYPWREILATISPIVGIQRPVPLFAFTTVGFLSVPAFFWFLWRVRGTFSIIGSTAALFVLFLAQSRGAYLAFLGSLMALLLLKPGGIYKRSGKIMVTSVIIGFLITLLGGVLTGRLMERVGMDTVVAQLETLAGREGPGAGSFQHRLTAWPEVIRQVLSEPLGPVVGIGLGVDLFQGFALGPDILVRRPHNDFLEIWARTGILGLLAWLGILISVGWEAVRGVHRSARNAWVLALQITLWITSFGQPAMGFAYTTVVWAGLTGLWIGSLLYEEGLVSATRPRRSERRAYVAPNVHP